jgi:NAD(P)-dependent dehydrogenase (short-subunit alcohol dehydrogenase family)/pimeloyl-ACP methyl ester carboxylesterase
MTRTTRTVDSGGAKLAVYERGDASSATVLLVHGYPDTAGVWDDVVDLLESRYHVVTYDVRGAGESDRPRGRAAYTLDQLAQDLRAVADAVSPDKPVHLVAHDWGSIQSWEAVTDDGAERRIASYTSVSGPCLDHVGYWLRDHATPRPHDLAKLLRQTRKSWYIGVFHAPLLAPLAWRAGLAKSFGATMERLEGFEHSDAYPAPTLASDGACGVQLYRANVVQRLRRPRERRTSVPVQVVVPLNDRYVSPPLVEGLDRWVDTLWVRRVQSGHWLPRQSPDVLARAITDLVDHVEGGPEPRALRRWRVTGAARREFADQLVVVTGAGSGIGRETALAFADLGAEIVIADLDEAAAKQTAVEVRQLGAKAHPHVVDVADVGAMERFAETVIAEYGVPEVVVNNAGIGIAGAFLDTTAADWQRIVDVNLLGVVHGCRLFGAAMVERREGGHIVNVASAAAFTPSRTLGAYSATKAAVLMLSECLRAELAGSGIGVSAICPGIVNTNITMASRYVGVSDDEQERRRRDVSRKYARRNYPPSKVAAAIVKAVQGNHALVPVTPEAVGARFLSRLSPGAMRRLAKLDVL